MPIRHFPNFPPTLFKREKRAVKSIRDQQPRTSNTTLPEGPETNWNTHIPKPICEPTVQVARVHVITTFRALHYNTLTTDAVGKHLDSTWTRTVPMSHWIHSNWSNKLLKGKKDSIITPATITL